MWTEARTHLGPRFSEGARRLWLALAARGWSQTKLEAELETKTPVSYWLYGDKKPSLENAFKLKRLLGIEPDWWNQPANEVFDLGAAQVAVEKARGRHGKPAPEAAA